MDKVASEKRFESGDNLTDIKDSRKYQPEKRWKVEGSCHLYHVVRTVNKEKLETL